MTLSKSASATLTSALLLFIYGCDCTRTVPTAQATSPEIIFAADDPIQTIKAYRDAVDDAREHLPADLKQAYGKKRLALCARELARLPSATSRRFASELIATLRRERILVDTQPPAGGTTTMHYAELARIEALTGCLLYTNPDTDEDGKNNIPRAGKIPFLTWVHVMATVTHASPCMSLTIPVPDDVMFPDMKTAPNFATALDLLKGSYRESRLQLLNARPTLNILQMFEEPSGWGYLLFSMANSPDAGESPHQLETVVDASEKLAREGKRVYLSTATQESLDRFLEQLPNLRKFAAILDVNILAAHEARPDLEKFVAAVIAGNDKDIKALVAPEALQTAHEWREWFLWKDKHNVVLFRVGVTEKPGGLMLSVLETDEDGKVELETHFVDVRQIDGRWRIVRG